MFIPIGDTPNPRNFIAWMNRCLIAVNVIIYLIITLPLSAQGEAYAQFVFEHGYKAGAPEFSDLMLAMFLHANFWHLVGNMLFLWIYGDNVEHYLGRLKYLLTYLATGMAATLFFAMLARNSMLPMIGASGAISGVLGIYFLLFPRNKVRIFIALFPFFMKAVLLPARIVLGFYIVLDNLLPFFAGVQSGVAYGAHIGGFFAGFGLVWFMERVNWRRLWQQHLGREVWQCHILIECSASAAQIAPFIGAGISEFLQRLKNTSFQRVAPTIALGVCREDVAYLNHPQRLTELQPVDLACFGQCVLTPVMNALIRQITAKIRLRTGKDLVVLALASEPVDQWATTAASLQRLIIEGKLNVITVGLSPHVSDATLKSFGNIALRLSRQDTQAARALFQWVAAAAAAIITVIETGGGAMDLPPLPPDICWIQ